MKNYIVNDPWKIIEEGFHQDYNRITESLCSIGNGKMGCRGNFAESYSGDSLQGTYYAGIYYPDKTKVGWWKNGYPEYFAKVLNGCNWIGLKIMIGDSLLDLAKSEVIEFRRELDMQKGLLTRSCKIKLSNGAEIEIDSQRFCSMDEDETAALDYKLKIKNFTGKIRIESFLDFDIENEDSNYDEKFWNQVETNTVLDIIYNEAVTKKTNFHLGLACKTVLKNNDQTISPLSFGESQKYISEIFETEVNESALIEINKYVGVCSSFYYPIEEIKRSAIEIANASALKSFDTLKDDHEKVWAQKWNESDIEIQGDVGAQQGIRFNIFHMNQTYTGKDARLNIGPKGFTGEKYGGSTYWDTEAYCLPFYLSTADAKVSRNLLIYRHNHLAKAIENAEKLGFEKGAALYPMVTINGEECHNEWEITFEEIHRNGAIAYAIFDYIRYTGDENYLTEYGLDVLIGIARFWAQRVNYSEVKKKYVMLGVTGPNEYENNVNNNWYTNYIAVWCLKYCIESLDQVKSKNKTAYAEIVTKNHFEQDEIDHWQKIVENMYFPVSEELGIFLQQDNFLDKDQTVVAELDPKHLPLNQNWSWDRILRSVYIKQADVLQGLFFFENDFSIDQIRKNFDYYEPRTVHESSLSPCVHVILACLLGKEEKAYEMYLRTSRLDLDDYNNDTEDGLHITSMAGTWMAVVKGFGGLRVIEDSLHFSPSLPKNWDKLTFRIKFRGSLISVKISKNNIHLKNESDKPLGISIVDQIFNLKANESKVHNL